MKNRSGGTIPNSRGLPDKKYREDIFAIDALLDECLADHTLRLHPYLTGITLRTLVLGETYQISGGGLAAFRSRFSERTEDRVAYLTLFFSRFFEAAPWILPPAAPQPLLPDLPAADHLKKYGLLLTARSGTHHLEIPERILGTKTNLDLSRSLTRPEPGEVVGFQILSGNPLEFILTKYRPCDAGEREVDFRGTCFIDGESSGKGEPIVGHSREWKVEVFLRQGTGTLYFPDEIRMETDRPANGRQANSGTTERENNTSRRKKMVFRQGGRPAIRGRLIHKHFQCL